MSISFVVKQISAAQTLPLRQKILKPFLTESECYNPGDELSSTYHFGLYADENLISVATFLLESHPDFSAGFPYRLRGMATDSAYQGKGLGQKVLNYGLHFLLAKKCDLVWCNAREKAFGFYEKMGFQQTGPLFEIKGIGPHKVMYKILFPR